jgi:hypothetical protein
MKFVLTDDAAADWAFIEKKLADGYDIIELRLIDGRGYVIFGERHDTDTMASTH